jgi:hypothetical protein
MSRVAARCRAPAPVLAAAVLCWGLSGCVDLLGDFQSCSDDCLSWAKAFGDTGLQRMRAVAVDREGDLVVVGDVSGTIDFGNKPLASAGLGDVFVAKLDPQGKPLWSHRFGGADDDHGFGVAVDPQGNVLVSGYFSGTASFAGVDLTGGHSDIFVAKLSSGGELQWIDAYLDTSAASISYQRAGSIASDLAGNIFVTGCMAGTIAFGDGDPVASLGGLDAFVLKLGPGGVLQWKIVTGADGTECGSRVATDQTGNVFVAGTFTSQVNFAGATKLPLASQGVDDLFLAKLSPGGNHLWSTSIGNSEQQIMGGLAVNADNDVAMTGMYRGDILVGGRGLANSQSLAAFIAVFDGGGSGGGAEKLLWSRSISEDNEQFLHGAAFDTHGDLFVSGATGSGPTDLGAYLAKLTSGGESVWSQTWSGTGTQISTGVAVDGADNVLLVGQFDGAWSLGDQAFSSKGSIDVFAAKLEPSTP